MDVCAGDPDFAIAKHAPCLLSDAIPWQSGYGDNDCCLLARKISYRFAHSWAPVYYFACTQHLSEWKALGTYRNNFPASLYGRIILYVGSDGKRRAHVHRTKK